MAITRVPTPVAANITGSSRAVSVDKSQVLTHTSTPVSSFTVTDGGTHQSGATQVIEFPPGQLTADAITIPAAFNGTVQGTFDDEKFTSIIMSAIGSQVVASVRKGVEGPDTTAPIITAAVIEAGTNDLVLTMSEVVIGVATTGLSLDFTTGTARTISSISGDGTATLALTLSGNVTDTDVFTIDADGTNTITDLSGNPLSGSTSESVTIESTGLPQEANILLWYSAAQQTSSTATQIDDVSSAGNHGTPVSIGITGSGASAEFVVDSGSDNILPGIPMPTGSSTILFRVRRTSGQAWSDQYRCLYRSTNGNDALYFSNASGVMELYHNSTQLMSSSNINGWSADTTHWIAIRRDGAGTTHIHIDSTTADVSNTHAAPQGSTDIMLLSFGGTNGYMNNVKDIVLWDVLLSTTELGDAVAALP